MAFTTCTNLNDERRRRRSKDPLVAMRFQLMQVMDDFKLKACVLASDEGLLLVSPESVAVEDAELLAAMGTLPRNEEGMIINDELVASFLDQLSGSITLDEQEKTAPSKSVYTQEFWAWDQPWIMVAVGHLSRAQELSLMRAIMGIRRIARQSEPVEKVSA